MRNGNRWRVVAVDPTTNRLAAERLDDRAPVLFEGAHLREHRTHGYTVTVHSAQGVTADTAHAVLGESTTRSTFYVALTRGRETNSAFIYERATEQEYGLDRLPGANVMKRSTAQHASRLARAIIANYDQPVTAHDIATQTPTAALPQRVQRIRDRRAAALQRRRASYQVWQADSESLRAMSRAVERHCSRGRSLDYGVDL